MRFLLSTLVSVMAVSVSASVDSSTSTVNRAGGWGHASMSLEAGRYEPSHAHRWGPMADATAAPGGTTHFTYSPYDLEAGPAQWATNFPTSQCGGLKQSPVQLPSRENAKVDPTLAPLSPVYDKTFASNTLSLRNTGHALQVDIPDGLTLTGGAVGANPYSVLQMHMHGRSEHSMLGATYPLEIHIVHRDNTRAATDARLLSVVGIMVTEHPLDTPNPALTPLVSLFPIGTFDSNLNNFNTSMKIFQSFQLKSLLPTNLDYYHYNGSLTTPPCSEQVVWHVLTTPITASRQQILALTAPFGDTGNARPTQQLNGRAVAVTSFQTPITPAGTGKCNSASIVSGSFVGLITMLGAMFVRM